jgi:hypothetical protein
MSLSISSRFVRGTLPTPIPGNNLPPPCLSSSSLLAAFARGRIRKCARAQVFRASSFSNVDDGCGVEADSVTGFLRWDRVFEFDSHLI